MLALIGGGSASGKSGIAEDLAEKWAGKKLYIATMHVSDAESVQKVERHREIRKDKGFTTMEIPYNLADEVAKMKNFDTILLDCMSNLFANTMFLQNKSGAEALNSVLQDINALNALGKQVVIVTNDVFADGERYNDFTEEYIANFGALNKNIGQMSDILVEVTAGIPLIYKGEL